MFYSKTICFAKVVVRLSADVASLGLSGLCLKLQALAFYPSELIYDCKANGIFSDVLRYRDTNLAVRWQDREMQVLDCFTLDLHSEPGHSDTANCLWRIHW